jgi:hypothetical protein
MPRGRIMLDAGSSSSCSYDFQTPTQGVLRLPEIFFTAHGETIHRATLQLEDGSHRAVDVVMGPRVGEAYFTAST